MTRAGTDEELKDHNDGKFIDYLAVGHLTLDTIDMHGQTLGGTALYAAITARNLGARVALYTSAAQDVDVAGMASGIEVHTVPAQYSTTLRIEYDEFNQRRQIISRTAENLTFTHLPGSWRYPRLIHLAPECHEIDLDLLDKFPDSFIAVTPQGWLRQWGPDGEIRPCQWANADRVLSRANAVVVSEHDVSDALLVEHWASKTPILVVTRGEEGCDVYTGGAAKPYHSYGFEAQKEMDPTGAGDVFAAAYFWWLAQGGAAFQGADWANCVASFAVEQFGCSGIPSLEAVERRWMEQKRTYTQRHK